MTEKQENKSIPDKERNKEDKEEENEASTSNASSNAMLVNVTFD